MTGPQRLHTTSLSRRVVLSSLGVLLVVLTTAGMLADVLLAGQLRSKAAERLDDRVRAAQEAVDSGAAGREVVAAAQGDGVTAVLVTTDGSSVGDEDVLPRGRPGAPGPPPQGPGRGPAADPDPDYDPDGDPDGDGDEAAAQLTRELSDGTVLTVAVDAAGIADVRTQLRTVLAPLLLGALVLAGLLLALATRTALRPLDRMTALARSISRGQRGRRLDPDRTDTELGRTAAAFDEMLDALEGAEATAVASEARTRRFVADAAHELRTPLAGVQAATEAALAAGTGADDAARERMQVLAVREARRAGRLVADLLSLAHIDSGLVLRPGPVDLAALVHAAVERTRLLSPHLDLAVEAPPCTVAGDAERLAQVLANLLDNARRHGGGRGLVQVRPGGGGAEVRVVDDGAGVPAADRERIFDRLVRLDDARTGGGGAGGSGLGLSIARGLARAHGGDLVCTDPFAGWSGAAFVLRLPR